MAVRRATRSFECVLIDINTQTDFCEPTGACPVANVEALLPVLKKLIIWAKRNRAPVISSIEAHRRFELSETGFPIHCVDGSCGQRKLDFTLFRRRSFVEIDTTLAIPDDLLVRNQQLIFRKRADDLLSNPKADRLLTQMAAREFVLFGTGLELSIKALTLALIARGKQVAVVTDACGFWHRQTADLALRQMAAKGARLVTSEELLARQLRRPRPRIKALQNGKTVSAATNGNGHHQENGNGHHQENGNGHANGAAHHEGTENGANGQTHNADA